MTLRRLWAILATPSPADEPPHTRAAVAAWHSIAALPVGMALSGVGWLGPVGLWALVFAAYWLLKERGDLRRGGYWQDGIQDSTAVATGAWVGQQVPADLWWPILVLQIVPVVIFALHVRREARDDR